MGVEPLLEERREDLVPPRRFDLRLGGVEAAFADQAVGFVEKLRQGGQCGEIDLVDARQVVLGMFQSVLEGFFGTEIDRQPLDSLGFFGGQKLLVAGLFGGSRLFDLGAFVWL